MTIADMLPKCKFICDIGTDHAYLPIFLLKNRICQKAIATDISRGPLGKAYSNINEKNLQEQIEVILGDGLKALENSQYLKDNKYKDYAIVIAGMGGNLIEKILTDGIYYAKKANAIVLQPMSRLEIVYEWLLTQGFEIIDERLVKDDGRIYNVLAVKWTGTEKSYKPIDLYIGKKLIEKNDPLLKEYISWKILILNKIIVSLKNFKDYNREKDNMGYLARLMNIRDEMAGLLKLLQKQ
jgi:tRNA (adenine22-N1)-methyltransferase